MGEASACGAAVSPRRSSCCSRSAAASSDAYVVKDGGRKIDGREIDLYIPDGVAAKRFGKRQVTVQVLRYGGGR